MLLRRFPDYPKDADAAFVALPYNSPSQPPCDGSVYFRETVQDN
jgi:hypothetical protein